MKKQLYRAAAATVLGLSLTTGIVAADTGNIHTTGPNSSNHIHSRVHNRTRVQTNNRVTLENSNDQTAKTGDARVTGNTHGGDATSGDVDQENATEAHVSVSTPEVAHLTAAGVGAGARLGSSDGSGGGSASIRDTGPNSDNQITSTVDNNVDVNTNNQVKINNTNDQNAKTGNATVSGNTHGGDATSGSVYQTNSSDFSVTIE